ncbi:hypothetical protein THRCLA_20017 [Thraustotheca clavata]|uniref:Uncharacterized protein n=1 Tax=Thraustotheca clavata TaxID=74557 RepID=A0A1W0ACD4_9STRA|nr:hypothetical protein THRCLA_20017 [Thraustotheca clavata]
MTSKAIVPSTDDVKMMKFNFDNESEEEYDDEEEEEEQEGKEENEGEEHAAKRQKTQKAKSDVILKPSARKLLKMKKDAEFFGVLFAIFMNMDRFDNWFADSEDPDGVQNTFTAFYKLI